jgi:transcriptional regulator with GAF, ATPase, and Fis domain
LKETPDAEALARLRACARVVMRSLAAPEVGREEFNMYEAVHDFESRLIERALEEAGGSVTKAARLLGLTHQTLGTILNTRHKSLACKRTPVRRRLRSIFKKQAVKPRH